MIDREKVIEELQDAVNDDWMWEYAEFYARTMEKSIQLLKEQPKWHVFHKCELTEEEKQEHPTWKWIMRVDCTPSHGEEFLLYDKEYKEIFLDHWDDDMWAEYACTMDGNPLNDGDAWMELPKPPEEEQG